MGIGFGWIVLGAEAFLFPVVVLWLTQMEKGLPREYTGK